MRPNTPRAYHVHTPEKVSNTVILDPKPRFAVTTGKLQHDLERQNVVASLIVLPRDTSCPDPVEEVLKWSRFARKHSLCPQLALVVTKTHTTEPTFFSETTFERVTLDAMRAANAQQLFYTDARDVAPSALTLWLLDVLATVAAETHPCSSRAIEGCISDNSDCGVCEDGIALEMTVAERALLEEQSAQQRTCDTCAVM